MIYVQSLPPDAAVAIGTLGICLGLVEFNRPGRILPGALGLLLFLFACAALLKAGVRPSATTVLGLATAALVLNAWRPIPLWGLALATVGLIVGFEFLIPSTTQRPVHTPVAVSCGAILGSLSGALTRIAYRARRSKALD